MHPTHATMFMPSRRSRGSHKLPRIEPCTPMLHLKLWALSRLKIGA